MKFLFICTLLLVGCEQHTSPEEQGDMIRRCEANGMDWRIVDFGRIFCEKKKEGCK